MAESGIGLEGRYRLWHVHPEHGLLWEADLENGVTVQGATYLLERGFRGGVAIQEWKTGLISEAGYTGVADTDTYSSHPGWSEAVVDFERGTWNPVAAQGAHMASGDVTVMPVASSATVRGVFLCSRKIQGDTNPSGTLYSTAVASAGLAVVAGGTVYVTYSIRARPVS